MFIKVFVFILFLIFSFSQGTGVWAQTTPAQCTMGCANMPAGDICCNGNPVNSSSDPNNCGACGDTVATGDSCCSGVDTNTSVDPYNCGACGNNVINSSSTYCPSGGQVGCANGAPYCTTTINDTICGGEKCGLGQTQCCGNACDNPNAGDCCNGTSITKLQSDPNNCGQCKNVCTAQVISNSSTPGTQLGTCDYGTCLTTISNCGALGNVCSNYSDNNVDPVCGYYNGTFNCYVDPGLAVKDQATLYGVVCHPSNSCMTYIPDENGDGFCTENYTCGSGAYCNPGLPPGQNCPT